MATRTEDVLAMTWDTGRSLAPGRAARKPARATGWAPARRSRAPWAGLALVALWALLVAFFVGGVAAPAGRLHRLAAGAGALTAATPAPAPAGRP